MAHIHSASSSPAPSPPRSPRSKNSNIKGMSEKDLAATAPASAIPDLPRQQQRKRSLAMVNHMQNHMSLNSSSFAEAENLMEYYLARRATVDHSPPPPLLTENLRTRNNTRRATEGTTSMFALTGPSKKAANPEKESSWTSAVRPGGGSPHSPNRAYHHPRDREHSIESRHARNNSAGKIKLSKTPPSASPTTSSPPSPRTPPTTTKHAQTQMPTLVSSPRQTHNQSPASTSSVTPPSSLPSSPSKEGSSSADGNPQKMIRRQHSQSALPAPERQKKHVPLIRVALEDFDVLKLIGKGAFGEVYLAKYRATGDLTALKQMDKVLIREAQKQQHVRNEKEILVKNRSPFMVNSRFYPFQSKECLYLVMEYCPGGDLKDFLRAIGCLDEEDAVMFFAEIIMGVFHLHKMGYMHRDLKPANFLIDKKGHLKLADFGLSKAGKIVKRPPSKQKEINYRLHRNSLLPGTVLPHRLSAENIIKKFRVSPRGTLRSRKLSVGSSNPPIRSQRHQPISPRKFHAMSVVGSPPYISPEVASGLQGGDGYGEEVDWWSVGCIFFEIIFGAPPISGDSPEEIFESIHNWHNIIPNILEQYREYMTEELFSLVSGLLCDSKDRLGRDIKKLQSHPFFKSIDWSRLHKMDSIFVPQPD